MIFNNRASIDFIKGLISNEQKQLLSNTEQIRLLESEINKILKTTMGGEYSLHSASQIAVALGISKNQAKWLAESEIIRADKINHEWKMTDSQLKEAREIIRPNIEVIKRCYSKDEFYDLLLDEEQQ